MTKLPKSIIKKYGITKKAWSVFRSGRSSSTRAKTRGGTHMAKRRAGGRLRRVYRSATRGAAIPMKDLLYSAGYGYARPTIANAMAPVIAYVPAGQYSDNVTLGLAAYVVNKFAFGGQIVKDATRAICINEAFLAGAKARAFGLGGMAAASTGSGSVQLL